MPVIDPEFANLCPALSDAERAQLEDNLKAEGCRDALVVWGDVLLDGHNRHEICARLGIDYRTVEAAGVETRGEAVNWIIANQLGRRNLSPNDASYLRGKRYNAEKLTDLDRGRMATDSREARRSENPTSVPQHQVRTADRIGSELGVNRTTVIGDGQFAAAIDTIAANVGEDAAREIRSGSIKVTKQQVREIGKMEPEQQAAALKQATAKPKRVTPSKLGKIAPMERAAISEAQKEAGKNFLHALRLLNGIDYEPEVLARMAWPENWRSMIDDKLADAHSYVADFAGTWKRKERADGDECHDEAA